VGADAGIMLYTQCRMRTRDAKFVVKCPFCETHFLQLASADINQVDAVPSEQGVGEISGGAIISSQILIAKALKHSARLLIFNNNCFAVERRPPVTTRAGEQTTLTQCQVCPLRCSLRVCLCVFLIKQMCVRCPAR